MTSFAEVLTSLTTEGKNVPLAKQLMFTFNEIELPIYIYQKQKRPKDGTLWYFSSNINHGKY